MKASLSIIDRKLFQFSFYVGGKIISATCGEKKSQRIVVNIDSFQYM